VGPPPVGGIPQKRVAAQRGAPFSSKGGNRVVSPKPRVPIRLGGAHPRTFRLFFAPVGPVGSANFLFSEKQVSANTNVQSGPRKLPGLKPPVKAPKGFSSVGSSNPASRTGLSGESVPPGCRPRGGLPPDRAGPRTARNHQRANKSGEIPKKPR